MSLRALSMTDKLAILDALTASAGALDDAKLRLYQNDVAPSEDSVAADFTACDFDGYADAIIADTAWGNAYLDSDGKAKVQAASVQFDADVDAEPQFVYGYVLLTSGGRYVHGERYDEPKTITGPLSAVVVDPVVFYGE